ncbi:MAG: hypothetical protein JWO94_39 [Verrucomicrobiaceae bacterium]|nr:hypothetical protein [Verrucomicrobiaceae bacterium]
MKIPADLFRWLAQGATLILAFGLGTQFGMQPAATSTALHLPAAIQKTAANVFAASHDLPPAATAPSTASLLPATQNLAGPAQRLARYIDAVSALSEPQTIAALRKLDLKADGFEAKIQRHVLLARFAEVDPQTALTYADTLSGDERSDQAANILTTWASRDPQAAAAHFAGTALNGGFASDEDRNTAAAIAGEWARLDPSSALSWAASLPEEVRSEARARVIASLAASNPSLAARTVAALPGGYERAEAMQTLAAQWAQASPLQASAWVQSLATPAEQASAATGLVTSWMNADPRAASQWVSKLSSGPARDAAIAALVAAPTLNNDPEAATLWASAIQDQTLRQQLVTETAIRWQRQDAGAAGAW